MNILLVTNFFSPVHGGSAEAPYRLSAELVRRGHRVTVYTSNLKLSRDYVDSVSELKVRAFKVWLNCTNMYLTPGLFVAKSLRKEIKHMDIIHMHNYRTFQNIMVYCYARSCGIPYLLQAHGSLTTFFQKKRLKAMFDRIWGYNMLKNATKVIAVTGIEAEQYKSMGVDSSKIEVVPNGIDLAEFSDLPHRGQFRKKYGFVDGLQIILFLGRIHKTKGLDLLIRAFASLPNASDVRLVFVGPDDGFLPTLRKLAAELRVSEKVTFIGPLYGREKLMAYVDADLYVLPSSYEIFGITILEALACGTPVVMTDRCGIADVINGKAGLAVPYDQDLLRDAILSILGDDRKRKEYGMRGRFLVQQEYSWSKIAGQVESLYLSILNAR